MSKVAIKGAATGTGVFTLESPATNTDRTLVLPDEAGTVLTDRVIAVDASAPDDSVVVDASGNVGIGTSSPAVRFHVSGSSTYVAGIEGSSAYALMGFKASGTTGTLDDANVAIGANGDALYFRSGGSEKARIDSSGNLLVGTTSSLGARLNVVFDPNLINGIATKPSANLTYAALDFQNSSGTRVGSVSVTSSATAYNTSSDYRLKEDWVAVADASTRVNALNPVNFAWKVDGSRVDGFLAHELAEVVPEAVTGEKDAVELVDIKDEDGNVTGQEERPVYQGIDQSKLVPLLTAALQEALARIETLEADVATLKGNA